MSQKIKVLFPNDFSGCAEMAFSTVQHLSELYDAEVFMLHVLEVPAGPAKLFSGFDEEKARKKANKALDDFIAKKGNSDTVYSKLVKVGKPYRKIVEAANELSANIIVMGTHGAEGLQEFWTGSNASRVINESPCPVLTFRKEPAYLGFKKILLPLDLTPESGEKLNLAIEFAEVFGADVHLIAVCQKEGEHDKKRLQKRLNIAAAHCQKHNVKATTTMLIAKESIANAITNYAEQIEADLICIMMQQGRGLKEQLWGTQAAKIVNHSPIPILSIKPVREYRSSTYTDAHFG